MTGFLGSGKTALIRHLLDSARRGDLRERIAVLVNEVGELGIDHHLVERVDEDVLMLAGGCVCCAVRGELHETVDRIAALGPDRMVLETTGLADPAPLLHGLASDARIAARVRLAGVVTVVDCLRIEDLYAGHDEVRSQLELADRIVLAKVDLAAERVDGVRAWLADRAPGREVRDADDGRVDAGWVLAGSGFDGRGGAGMRAWLADRPGITREHAGSGSAAHAGFTVHRVRVDRPVDLEVLDLWMRLVTQVDGPRLLRIKGLVRCARTGGCFAVHAAGRSISPPRPVAHPPDGLLGAEIVLIERGMPEAAMAALLESLRSACAEAPAGDDLAEGRPGQAGGDREPDPPDAPASA